MSEWAEIISAISSLLWPLFAFTFLILFRDQIKDLMKRIKKGKLLGQEIELDQQLGELEESAAVLSKGLATQAESKEDQYIDVKEDSQAASSDETIKQIIEKAAQSPTAALMLLTTEIEKVAKEILISMGRYDERKSPTLPNMMNEFGEHLLPSFITNSLRLFWDTRNKLVHGRNVDDRNIMSAIDSGITIFKALKTMPVSFHTVLARDIAVYSDPKCENEINDAKGVIIETESSTGVKKSVRIFPTTCQHFYEGMKVSWEWNTDKSWRQSWYKDPQTGEIKQAWGGSGEFIGRNIEDI